MKDLLKSHKKIIINTDIDGVLSGLILTNYLGCQIVGFSNSRDTVWLDKNNAASIYDATYIDMFVPNIKVPCIDQHIISVNERHHQILFNNKIKINPNLENPRFHLPNDSYYKKYPFGTIHFIIATLESQGFDIDLDLTKEINTLKFGDILLRADDAMKTTVVSSYVDNARSWWKWLQDKSGNSNCTNSMIQYLASLSPEAVSQTKHRTTQLLTGYPFNCEKPDGGFKQILNDSMFLLENVKNYFKLISEFANLKCFNLEMELTPFIGRADRIQLDNSQIDELINTNKLNGQDLFSYAFVMSSNKAANFSYTIM